MSPLDKLEQLEPQVIQLLCQILRNHPLAFMRQTSADTLGKMKVINEFVIQQLYDAVERDNNPQVQAAAMRAIGEIYSYALTQRNPTQSTQNMSDQPRVQMNFNAPVTGVAGNVEGDLIINTESQSLTQSLAEIQQILNDLQQKHSQAADSEISTIIEAEFREIKQKQPWQWQNLLNLKRLWKGSKASALKVGEHFTEENIWGKAFLGFLEGVSEE
jgi:CheY-specific phosphatase CheX